MTKNNDSACRINGDIQYTSIVAATQQSSKVTEGTLSGKSDRVE